MSSGLQSTLEHLVLNSRISLTVVTVVVYDYLLTFSREIEYIWLRPWTWVSTMFVVVRYIGLCWIITNALTPLFLALSKSVFHLPFYALLATNDLIPTDGLKLSCGYFKGTVIYQISSWAFIVFLSAADLMMILRVYAMWNRSRTILSILLFIYVPQSIISVVLVGIYNNPNTHLSVTLAQVLDLSFCNVSYMNTPAILFVYNATPRVVLAAALVIFAVSQTLKQSFEMYKATKQWQPNRYIKKLVGDGILYFFVYVLYQIDFVLTLAVAPTNNTLVFLGVFLYVAFYILVPRFIISIRELYDHDVRGRFHADNGFGVQLRSSAGLDTTVSAMVFVDGNQSPEVAGGTTSSVDVELGRVHGSGLHEDSPIEGSE
ncbi:hypothetical protein EV363DRAFT_1171890 [Boletus edulis]|nr:hypothetical protein EV363DRAFT_1171890 [Boletus edulis]